MRFQIVKLKINRKIEIRDGGKNGAFKNYIFLHPYLYIPVHQSKSNKILITDAFDR